MGMFPKIFKNMTAEALNEAKKEEYGKTIATAVSLRYQGNSQLLAGFYDAIENKVIN